MEFVRFKMENRLEVSIGKGAELQASVLACVAPMVYGNPLYDAVSVTIERVSQYMYRYTMTTFVKAEKGPKAEAEKAELEKQGWTVTELKTT